MNEKCPVCGGSVTADDAACPSCGFKLLGATQRFSPITTETSASAPDAASSRRRAHLRVIRGPQPEVVFELGAEPMTIGRNPQCDVFLNDMTVSRAHAVIEPRGTGFAVTDTDSFNGVWVNNVSVESAPLHSGDVLQIGVFCLAYEEE